jgi:hypothetical protein
MSIDGGGCPEPSNYTIYTMLENSFTSRNLPALYNHFTAGPNCSERWVASGVAAAGCNPATGLGTKTSPSVSSNAVWSTQPDPTSTEYPYSDALYTSCQPGSVAPTYSPGVCPQGQEVAQITEYQFSDVSSGITQKEWRASCCRRYGPIQGTLEAGKITSGQI